MSDAVIDAIIDKYSLDNPPIAVCGGSMGGVGALAFATSSTHSLACVALACPCVDILACFNCHPDFPRTLISAVASYESSLEDGLKEISPIENLDKFKKVPYFICSDGADEIFPESQCNDFVDKMQSKGYDVTYRKQPDLKHGGFFPEVRAELHDFILKNLLH
jgi:dipeptidyl aminopeptidase/acylaminoacyl peptidase